MVLYGPVWSHIFHYGPLWSAMVYSYEWKQTATRMICWQNMRNFQITPPEMALKKLMKIYNCIEKDCMMIIIMHGALLSQALTDSARKQCED